LRAGHPARAAGVSVATLGGRKVEEVEMTDSEIERRTILRAGVAMAVAGAPLAAESKEPETMYGLIGQMIATDGKRDELIAILEEATGAMPGCLSYILAKDAAHADALWITEVWQGAEYHAASLKLPAVQAAIVRARPIIAGFGQRFETVPVGGVGLSKA
jgi:quinol monooxygenase YgiN